MFVLSKANEVGLIGWVKNMPAHDEVDAVFCGEKEIIDLVIESLKLSVGLIRVDRVFVELLNDGEVFKSFSIKY